MAGSSHIHPPFGASTDSTCVHVSVAVPSDIHRLQQLLPAPSRRCLDLPYADGTPPMITGHVVLSSHDADGGGADGNGCQMKRNQELGITNISANRTGGFHEDDPCKTEDLRDAVGEDGAPYGVQFGEGDEGRFRHMVVMVDIPSAQMPSGVGHSAGITAMKGGRSRSSKVTPYLDDGGNEKLEQKAPKSSHAYSMSPFPESDAPVQHEMVQKDVKIGIEALQYSESAGNSPKISKPSFFPRSSFYGLRGLPVPRRLLLLEAILRAATAVFSLITFSVMFSTHETRSGAGSTFEVKFSDFQAYEYLSALNLLSFLYSSAQMMIALQSNDGKINSFISPIKSGVCKYAFDQVLALLLFSASSSAATASQLAIHGLHNIWPPACSTWKLWILCRKADAAIAISFLSSFSMMLSSLFSGFRLLNLLLM